MYSSLHTQYGYFDFNDRNSAALLLANTKPHDARKNTNDSDRQSALGAAGAMNNFALLCTAQHTPASIGHRLAGPKMLATKGGRSSFHPNLSKFSLSQQCCRCCCGWPSALVKISTSLEGSGYPSANDQSKRPLVPEEIARLTSSGSERMRGKLLVLMQTGKGSARFGGCTAFYYEWF